MYIYICVRMYMYMYMYNDLEPRAGAGASQYDGGLRAGPGGRRPGRPARLGRRRERHGAPRLVRQVPAPAPSAPRGFRAGGPAARAAADCIFSFCFPAFWIISIIYCMLSMVNVSLMLSFVMDCDTFNNQPSAAPRRGRENCAARTGAARIRDSPPCFRPVSRHAPISFRPDSRPCFRFCLRSL